MNGMMKGWNFLRKLSADGSTTQQNLIAEKKRLEARYAEIPGQVSKIQNSINLTQSDITWLNSLSDRRKKNWEKENGKDIDQVIWDANIAIVNNKAEIDKLNTERARIPDQIKEIDRQLASLVKGESDGLSKGLTAAVAKQLGEAELVKEQQKIEHENAIQQVQLQQAKAEADTATAAATAAKKGMSPQVKWGLIIGGTILLIVIGIVIYKRSQATGLPQPVKL